MFCLSHDFQIIELFIGYWHSSIPSKLWKLLKEILKSDILSFDASRCALAVGQSICEVRATRVLLQVLVLGHESDSEFTIMELLRHRSYEVVHETLVVLERLMSKDLQVMNEEVEDIIPDVVESMASY